MELNIFNMSKNLSLLIESELEKAEVVLASKAVLDKIQRSVEAIAKIEAEDIMPLLDTIKLSFGPEHAERFSKIASENLRNAVETISATKDSLSTEVMRFEKILNGEPASDMAFDTQDPQTDLEADLEANEPEEAPEEAEDDFANALADELTQEPEEPEEEPDVDLTEPEVDNAAGRARRESAFINGSPLMEVRDPDAYVRKRFRHFVKEGYRAIYAAKAVALECEIDVDDVIEIVRER